MLVATPSVALPGMPGAAGAQDARDGFYAGLQIGPAIASTAGSSLGGVNHPTRCDVLLYPASVSPPVDDAAGLNFREVP